MLHSLDLAIVAEGVETEESLTLCQEINVHRIQGYLLSKPLEISVIDERYFSR